MSRKSFSHTLRFKLKNPRHITCSETVQMFFHHQEELFQNPNEYAYRK